MLDRFFIRLKPAIHWVIKKPVLVISFGLVFAILGFLLAITLRTFLKDGIQNIPSFHGTMSIARAQL